MSTSPSILVDRNRSEQLRWLVRSPIFSGGLQSWFDGERVPWVGKFSHGHWFAVSGLGPSWVFDPFGQSRRTTMLAERWARIREFTATDILADVQPLLQSIRCGAVLGRVYWSIHRRAIESRRSVFHLPAPKLQQQIWGRDPNAVPRNWRAAIALAMETLSHLHLTIGNADDQPPLGQATALLLDYGDLRHSDSDHCEEDCPLRDGVRHDHFRVNIGRGFLGCLEQCCVETDEVGVRYYEFLARGRSTTGATLQQIGSGGDLMSAYLPALLGEPRRCANLTPQQHQLFQALLRETTRRDRRSRRTFSEPKVIEDGLAPNAQGRASIPCPDLASGSFLGFNGNGKRSGCGYRLCSTGGWLAKAGYDREELDLFLNDLEFLTCHLNLTVVGLLPGTDPVQWLTLEELRRMADTRAATHLIQRVHVRVYAAADCLNHWQSLFGWPYPNLLLPEVDLNADLANIVRSTGVAQNALARALEVDPSLLSKILRGQRRCSRGLLERAQRFLHQPAGVSARPANPSTGAPASVMEAGTSPLEIARSYRTRGWAVIPQRPGTKMPYIRWKPFQTELPTEDDLARWWATWPEAGIALIAGPLSGVLVVDVDGQEAHEMLIRRLGCEPCAPKVLSGSREPFRYHLFFQHPNLSTKSKATPWHPKLEFRGNASLNVLPPSRHRSGHVYAWDDGRSLNDLPLPELPPAIYDALNESSRPRRRETAVGIAEVTLPVAAAPSTVQFLRGELADGPRWNDRLFRASADLAGRRVPLAVAEPLLLAGAQPWSAAEHEAALRTITSAYGNPREPGRQ